MPTVTLNCIADTYIDSDMPNTHFGTGPNIAVGGTYDPYRYAYAFLLFDELPTDFSWDEFITVKLKLYEFSGDDDSFCFHFHEAGVWSETTTTWNNRPTENEVVVSIEKTISSDTLLTFEFTKEEFMELIRGNNPNIMISSNLYKPLRAPYFNSRENPDGNPPIIELTYSAPDCVDCIFPVEDENGNPLSGVRVTADRAPTCFGGSQECYTDSTGECTLHLDENTVYDITYSKDGYQDGTSHIDTQSGGTFPTETLYPDLTPTTTTADNKTITVGDPLTLTATLKETFLPNLPISFATIKFYIDDVWKCDGLTDTNGVASCNPGTTSGLSVGTHTIKAVFEGDIEFAESEDTATLTVNDVTECPAPSFESVSIDNSPVAGVETTISWNIEPQPSEVTDTEYYVYIYNNTKSETYYDDIVEDNSLLITYPLDSVGDNITVEVSAWNWCDSDDSDSTTHEETVIPVESHECPEPIITDVEYSPITPIADDETPFVVDITIDNPQDNVYYEYTLMDASTDNPLSGTSVSGYGDSTFHDETVTIPEEYAEREAYLLVNVTNICDSNESSPAIYTSPNFTIMGVSCKLHFVLYRPTRYLEENTDLIFEGKIPNKLSDTATVKLVFTKPDLTTYEHIIENVEPCTLNDFSVTFPYSEDLYGNWTAEPYNNDILIAPEIYIQILTEEEWERRKTYSDIKNILFILGAAALAYILIGGGNNG